MEARDIPVPDIRLDFSYDPATGVLTWLRNKRDCTRGAEAGTKNPSGYLNVHYAGRKWRIHRLIWIWVHGPIPDGKQIDHINRVRDDNRIANLRIVSRRDNTFNSAVFDNRSPDQIGTVFCRKTGLWRAQMRVGGKRRYFGDYKTMAEASAAYQAARAGQST